MLGCHRGLLGDGAAALKATPLGAVELIALGANRETSIDLDLVHNLEPAAGPSRRGCHRVTSLLEDRRIGLRLAAAAGLRWRGRNWLRSGPIVGSAECAMPLAGAPLLSVPKGAMVALEIHGTENAMILPLPLMKERKKPLEQSATW